MMMIGTYESCVSCSLIVLTFFLTLCHGPGQSEAQTCRVTDSPHPHGLCGEDLAQAHANLCFLLSIAYPDIFGKRSLSPSAASSSSSLSSSSSSLSSSSESLPLSSYFSSGVGGGRSRNKRGSRRHARGNARFRRETDDDLLERIYSIPLAVLAKLKLNEENWRSVVYKRGVDARNLLGEQTQEIHFRLRDLDELPAGPTRTLIRMLSKRSLPSVQKRDQGLVCECCINSCVPQQMATYC